MILEVFSKLNDAVIIRIHDYVENLVVLGIGLRKVVLNCFPDPDKSSGV